MQLRNLSYMPHTKFCIYYKLFFSLSYGVCEYLDIIFQLTIPFSILGAEEFISLWSFNLQGSIFIPSLLIFYLKNTPFHVSLPLFYSILQIVKEDIILLITEIGVLLSNNMNKNHRNLQ